MMILPLADTLQNCLQNLTSRIAGIDNEQMTGRVMGMGAMLGFGIGAIKEQFKTPNSSTNSNNGNNENGFNGFINRAKSIITPSTNLSNETDYNGNVNPIRNVIPKQSKENSSSINPTKTVNKEENSKMSGNSKTLANRVVNTSFNATKAYLDLGARMVEGDFNKNSYKTKPNNIKNKLQDTEYIYKTQDIQKLGDKNEIKKEE